MTTKETNTWKIIGTSVSIMIALLSFMGHKIYANQVNITEESKTAVSKRHALEIRSIERHEAIMTQLAKMDTRITKIESSRFTAKDAEDLTKELMNRLPPRWLIDKVHTNCDEIKELKKK